MTSAPGEPPGSRVRNTRVPRAVRRSASRPEWVDLPVPSPPSKVMNRPRISLLAACPVIAAPPHASRASRARACAPGGALEAGPEQPEHELGGGIEGALRHRAGAYALSGLQRRLEHDGIAAPDLQGADLLALLHRRRHRPAVDHTRDDLLARVTRHHQPHLLAGDERHAALRAAVDLGVG